MNTSTGTVQVWHEDRSARLRDLIRQLYAVVAALQEESEGRRFTPDGHLVGSIGEVVAAYAFNLTPLPASNAIHDLLRLLGEGEDCTGLQSYLPNGLKLATQMKGHYRLQRESRRTLA